MFELDVIKQSTPKHLRAYITQDLVDMLNKSGIDDTILEEFKENFVTYSSVLSDGKYKIVDYVNAVKYVTNKMLGKTNTEAYIATFPDRYKRLQDKGITDISSYSSMYNSNKLVTSIMQQALVPIWITNANIHQQAINEQFKLGTDPKVAPMVRAKALDSVLTHTKAPDTKNLNIEIGVSNSDTIQELNETINKLAKQQQELINGGASIKDVLEANIIDVEVEDDYRDN